MSAFRKVIYSLLFVGIFSLYLQTFANNVFAEEDFRTDYSVIYTVKEDGVTHADMKVALTNTKSNYYYASMYKVLLGFDQVTNVVAVDEGGELKPKVDKTDTGHTIEVTFNKKVLGVGNKKQFTISFDTFDVAQKVGKIWEINIPGIEDEKSFNTFNVELKTPASFGKPVYIKPAQPDNKLIFSKEELASSGISLAYGTEQQYSFSLKYHLQNKNLFPIRTEIALPPSTNYQEVFLNSLTPEPEQVKKDSDGNWLAQYTLKPASIIEVSAQGYVNLYLSPKSEPMKDEELLRYIKEKPYWQYSSNSIKELARKYTTPEEIYRFVVETLEYDYTRVTNSSNRLGALNVLDSPSSAVCLEFTDLFIAIARAAGIPAREVDGFAFTQNPRQRPLSLLTDILHAWPEYYDKEKQTWIMIDPTWADTTGGVDYFNTLDFDHFVFVKKGESSVYPVPAGGYKLTGQENSKDVFITASTEEIEANIDLQVLSVEESNYIAGFPLNGYIAVVNKGNSISELEKLIVKTNNLTPNYQELKIDPLLPYERRNIPLSFSKKPFLTYKTFPITMHIADKQYQQNIEIVPIYVKNWKIIGGIIIVLFAGSLFIFTFKTRRLRFFK